MDTLAPASPTRSPVPVERITSLVDLLRCGPYSATITARTCLSRQAATAAADCVTLAAFSRCVNCPIGRGVASRVALPGAAPTVHPRHHVEPEPVPTRPRPVPPPDDPLPPAAIVRAESYLPAGVEPPPPPVVVRREVVAVRPSVTVLPRAKVARWPSCVHCGRHTPATTEDGRPCCVACAEVPRG